MHIWRNTVRDLTRNPRHLAAKRLLGIAKALLNVTTIDHATTWITTLHAWKQRFDDFLKERTYYAAPGSYTHKPHPQAHSWAWTHRDVRKAYFRLEKLVTTKVLFAFLDPDIAATIKATTNTNDDDGGVTVPRTTNTLEGGINAPLRAVLRMHPGMPIEHRRQALQWWLYEHSEAPQAPHTLIKPEHYNPPAPVTLDEPIGPARYDNHYNPEDGNHLRKGWAGRP